MLLSRISEKTVENCGILGERPAKSEIRNKGKFYSVNLPIGVEVVCLGKVRDETGDRRLFERFKSFLVRETLFFCGAWDEFIDVKLKLCGVGSHERTFPSS